MKTISNTNAFYILGFVDGEGSFNISFKDKGDYKLGFKITASFNVSQKEFGILQWLKDQFNCGTIRARNDGLYYFEVTNIKDLQSVIIPFFQKYPLKTKKQHAFKVFCQIVELMLAGEHLTKAGIVKIFKLRDQVKVGRKRKHKLEEVITRLNF